MKHCTGGKVSTKLHQVKALEVLAPKYTTEFICVGPECPDSCCSGWAVSVDKKTHNSWNRIQNPVLTPLLSTKVTRTRGARSDAMYSEIALDTESKNCPFLEHSLCSIQMRLGEEKLSNTCYQYPRSTKLIGGIHQQAMTLSCPQAAKLALSNHESMSFEKVTIRTREATVVEQSGPRHLSRESLNYVRFAMIRLVKVSTVPLWQRLASLAVACELVRDYMKSNKAQELSTVLDKFEEALRSRTFSAALDELVPDHFSQSFVLARVWGGKSGNGSNKHQREVQDQVISGLGINLRAEGTEPSVIVEHYKEGLALLSATLEANTSLLENFILNEIFKEIFPFGYSDPTIHYRHLVVKFGVVRLMLGARCRHLGRPLSQSEAIDTIQVFSRLYEHWSPLSEHIEKVLASTSLTEMSDTYRFLKH